MRGIRRENGQRIGCVRERSRCCDIHATSRAIVDGILIFSAFISRGEAKAGRNVADPVQISHPGGGLESEEDPGFANVTKLYRCVGHSSAARGSHVVKDNEVVALRNGERQDQVDAVSGVAQLDALWGLIDLDVVLPPVIHSRVGIRGERSVAKVLPSMAGAGRPMGVNTTRQQR